MTQKDEALRIAIEALEGLCESFMLGNDWKGIAVYDNAIDALNACKEALKGTQNETN